MLNEAEFISRATPIFASELEQPGMRISLATTRDDCENWDSLAHVRVIVAIEGEFGVQFDVAEIESFASVGDIYRALNKSLSA